ncbi:hypothetical protein NDU88_005585 [Pleurodeles waltl]|uniref:Uncharacterized protein n=1 Tax=Pleurodeles waltl TaxID=8319 RepID=A0AAV7L9T8_PLEWA|nr:hypothetical protein NDU88_005585 [Pleurodeles waltl]
MGGSLVQPENKRSEIKSKTDPSKKESSAPTCSLVQKDLCVEKDICEPLGDRNTRRQSTDSSERAQHTAQHTRKQMRAKPSSKTDGSVSVDYKRHHRKEESRENGDLSNQKSEKTGSKQDLPVPKEVNDHSSKGFVREYSQQMMVNRKQEKHLVKHDICTSSDDVNPGPKDTNRVSSQQMTSDKRERDCSKGDRVVSIDFKSHGPKAEISWDRGKQIMNEMREKRVSKADFPIALVIKDHCDEAEPR